MTSGRDRRACRQAFQSEGSSQLTSRSGSVSTAVTARLAAARPRGRGEPDVGAVPVAPDPAAAGPLVAPVVLRFRAADRRSNGRSGRARSTVTDDGTLVRRAGSGHGSRPKPLRRDRQHIHGPPVRGEVPHQAQRAHRPDRGIRREIAGDDEHARQCEAPPPAPGRSPERGCGLNAKRSSSSAKTRSSRRSSTSIRSSAYRSLLREAKALRDVVAAR